MGEDHEKIRAMLSRLSPELVSRIAKFSVFSGTVNDSTLDCQSFAHYVSDTSVTEPHRWAPPTRRFFARRMLYSDCHEEDRIAIDRTKSVVHPGLRIGDPCIFYDERGAPLHCALVVGVEPLQFLSRYGERYGLVFDDLSQLTTHYPATSFGPVRFRWLWGPDQFLRSQARLRSPTFHAFRALLSLCFLAALPQLPCRNLEEFLIFP